MLEPVERPSVDGFSLVENYVPPEEEKELLAQIDASPWEKDWRRRIQQYGLGYGSEDNQPRWLRDFPE